MAAQIFRRYKKHIPSKFMRSLINIWPPFIGSGIHILESSEDLRSLTVELRRAWYNINYVGVQFGGSIYAMVDPFYMLMLMHNLGDDYIVWDKGAHIQFLKPGRTVLRAEFVIDEKLINDIKFKTSEGQKYVFDLPVEVRDTQCVVIAKVTKTMYVRRKNKT